MMANPYVSRPDFTFWRRAVATVPVDAVDPVIDAPFRMTKKDKIATIGSCFAQHISQMLVREDFNYFVTEREPLTPWACDEGYGVFPARFGNVYTVRQLLQLFERAYGLFWPKDVAWRRPDGRFIDPFRPRIQKEGFPSVEAVVEDRSAHLLSVRTMFENFNVLVFTLGLTESWISSDDGAVFPLAPGVVADGTDGHGYAFHNFSVQEMVVDLTKCINFIREINPHVKIILTVSPVPLIATYENKHVMVATTYSKSALRVLAEMVSQSMPGVVYFPSYEIITGSYTKSRYFADNLRDVTPEGVDRVMHLFKTHYLSKDDDNTDAVASGGATAAETTGTGEAASLAAVNQAMIDSMVESQDIICDEEVLDQFSEEALR